MSIRKAAVEVCRAHGSAADSLTSAIVTELSVLARRDGVEADMLPLKDKVHRDCVDWLMMESTKPRRDSIWKRNSAFGSANALVRRIDSLLGAVK